MQLGEDRLQYIADSHGVMRSSVIPLFFNRKKKDEKGDFYVTFPSVVFDFDLQFSPKT